MHRRRLSLVASHLVTTSRPLSRTTRIPTNPISNSSSSIRKMATSTETKSDITLYTQKTPNGIKVSMLLEELGVPYKVREISFSKLEQKEPWFLEINPNGRIPALTDTFTDGAPIRLFESASIMQYLIDRYDPDHKFSYPHGSREHYEVNNWLFWQMGGLGPMQGQANHFFRYAPEKIEYGIQRYQGETKRLYSVMDTHLAKSTSGYLVGDRITVADFACWGWVNSHDWAGVSLDGFPSLEAWWKRISERPATAKGKNVPYSAPASKPLTEEEKDKLAKEASSWVLQTNEHTAKK